MTRRGWSKLLRYLGGISSTVSRKILGVGGGLSLDNDHESAEKA